MVYVVDFRRIRNEKDLAGALACSEDLIRSVLAGDKDHFEHHRIPKKNSKKGYRDVWEITKTELSDALKSFHVRFSDFARENIDGFLSDAVHGYRSNRSIVSNAKAHIGARLLLRADIQDFFPTISVHRLEGFLSDMGMDLEGARLVSKFVTLHGALPLGFPSSPVLANAVCARLDQALTALAMQRACCYTRYADDLTFSTKGSVLPEKIEISSILRQEGFTLAPDKFRIKKRGQSFYVTGLSVSDPNRPRAPKSFKRGLRQELYYIEKLGLKEHLGRRDYPSYQEGINKIDGSIRFLMSVERELALRLKQRWDAALQKADASPSYQPRRERPPRNVSLFIDESVIKTPHGEYFLLGCVTTEDAEPIRQKLYELWQGLLSDPYATKRSKLDKQGLHWADLNEDARGDLVKSAAFLPIRAYVIYTKHAEEEYEQTYLRLLEEICRPRFIALDGCNVTVTCEVNSKVRRDSIVRSIHGVYSQLKESHSRAPRNTPDVKVAKKLDELCLALADCILGVLGQYAVPASEGENSLASNRFERLRAKFRTIRSDETNEVFTRRRPFVPWGERHQAELAKQKRQQDAAAAAAREQYGARLVEAFAHIRARKALYEHLRSLGFTGSIMHYFSRFNKAVRTHGREQALKMLFEWENLPLIRKFLGIDE